MKTFQRAFLGSILLFWTVLVAANPIEYQVTNLSSNTWEYSYSVHNHQTASIDGFTIWFDLGVYENLSITKSPTGWDPIIAQPDPSLPDAGFADWLALASPIVSGETLGGFSVSFDYLGAGTPGSQYFEINPFGAYSDGYTQLSASTVPTPGTLLLLGIGLTGLYLRKTQRR